MIVRPLLPSTQINLKLSDNLTLSIQSLKSNIFTASHRFEQGEATPEESPAKLQTGIVKLRDLIDCANTFKEIITMPARSLICQNQKYTEPLHPYRRQSLITEATKV